jgi:large subunit ribosomal protein L21e
MTTFGKGYRAGTRRKLAAPKRKKFKVEPLIQKFEEGERVVIKQDPSSHGGMPHIRFRGKVCTVKSKRGSAYVLSLRLGKKEKEIIAGPEHLKLIKQ